MICVIRWPLQIDGFYPCTLPLVKLKKQELLTLFIKAVWQAQLKGFFKLFKTMENVHKLG